MVYLDTLGDGKDRTNLRVDGDDYYYAFTPRESSTQAYVYCQEAANQQLGAGIDAIKANTSVPQIRTFFHKTATGYSYEIAFPQLTLQPIELRPGYVFGLGLYVVDKDEPGQNPKAALSLSSPPGSSCWRQANLWPQVVLE